MLKVLLTIYFAFRSAFKSQSQLEAEIVSLRHQLNIALRKRSCRVQLSNFDRSFLVGISRAFPTVLESVKVVRTETVTRWHRQGVRRYWRWRSPGLRLGRPKIDKELRDLIQRMCRENPLWGSPRIHGELLKLGFSVAQSTVAKLDPSRKSGGALHRLHCFCLEFDGACEVQRRVPTDWIIEPVDVSGYGSFSLAS